jgi:alpha-beta hydrolase superfamily lysophospholipase
VLTTAAPVQTEHTQVWFGTEERPLFGWVSMPADGRARGGVLLCPPMGEESRAAHRTFRRLAEALAEQGLVALRFDYEGTGDSAGLQDDPDRVPAWLASVEAARGYLLDLGVPSVAAVGMRLGATLAATQASAGGPFGSLVLWDPCLSGRTFLREGEALYSFVEDLGQPPDDGYRHTPGFQYDRATASAMRTLDFGRLPTDRRLADRVLLLSRTDRPVAEGIEKSLRDLPGELETGPATAQDMLLDRTPSDCYVPEEALAAVVTWLAEDLDDADDVPVKSPHAEHAVLVGSAGPGSGLVRERSMRIGEVGIFAMAAEPVVASASPEPAPWVVLVNVAAEHHIGPGRRWVEYARSWAGMGYRVLRLDQSGIGDSPTHPGQDEDRTFAPQWIDDMRDVVRTLSAGGAAVIMVGLCSGAYSAFEVAMWEHVAAVFAVNPRLTLYPAAKGTAVYTDRRRAAVLPIRPVARLAERHRILAGGLWRIYRQLAAWHAPFLVLRRVLQRGTDVQVIACRDDAQHFTEVAFWRPWLWWLRRTGRLQLERDDLIDHSLLAREAQVEAFERGTLFIEKQAARAAGGRTW